MTALEQLEAFLFGRDRKLTPQQEASHSATLLKARNAHRLAPAHPPYIAPHSAVVVFDGPLFLKFDAQAKFVANPCFIARGMDRRTLYAATRRAKRGPDKRYEVGAERAEAFIKQLVHEWALDHARRKTLMLPPGAERGTLAQWSQIAAQTRRQIAGGMTQEAAQ